MTLAVSLVQLAVGASPAQAATVRGPYSLGGGATSGPSAVSWDYFDFWNDQVKEQTGREDVFVRGPNNALYQRYDSGRGWSRNWVRLGGYLTSDPDATSYGEGQLDVFVRGGNNKVYQKYYPRSAGGSGWSAGWDNLGSPPGQAVVGGPTAVVAGISSGNPYFAVPKEVVFVRGQDNHLWYRVQEGGNWTAFGPWRSLGLALTADPEAAVWRHAYYEVGQYGQTGERIDVFVRDTHNAMVRKSYLWNTDGVTLHLAGSVPLGGVLTTGPGASSIDIGSWGTEDVFALDANRTLRSKGWHAGSLTTTWRNFGVKARSAPDAAYPGGILESSNKRPGIDVFYRGTDNHIWYLNYYPY